MSIAAAIDLSPRPKHLLPLVLIGPPGAGKSTLGRRLGQMLDLPFIDLDADIAEGAGKSIREIFAAEGEIGFRLREFRALQERLVCGGARVIAVGAGLTTQVAACELLERHARVVWLDATPEVAVARLQAQAAHEENAQRPLLGDEPRQWLSRYVELEASRNPARQRLADLYLDTSALGVKEASETLYARVAMEEISLLPDAGALNRAGVHIVTKTWDEHMLQRLPASAFAIVDAGCPLAHRHVSSHLPPDRTWSVRGGEDIKHLSELERIAEQLLQMNLTRDAVLVAIGGGALLDCVGFLASTLFRGLRWIAVPTTLLAMVDATLGGKTAVNLSHGKNLLGAFHAPQEIWVWPGWLSSLPARAFAAGAAEMCKHAFLMGDAPSDGSLHPADAGLLTLARANIPDDVTESLMRSLAFKARVVEADPWEGGLRKILNLGHTLGHVYERAGPGQAAASSGTDDTSRPLWHGEAVAHGLQAMLQLSVEFAGLPAHLASAYRTHIEQIPVPPRPRVSREGWSVGLRADKKRRADGVDLILLSSPGRPRCVRVETAALSEYASRSF